MSNKNMSNKSTPTLTLYNKTSKYAKLAQSLKTRNNWKKTDKLNILIQMTQMNYSHRLITQRVQ
jgi:hypothetical protein